MASRRTTKTAQATQAADTTATDVGAESILRTNFSSTEQDIAVLLRAASLLVEADTPEKVNSALDHNLKVWVAIKTVVQSGPHPLAGDVKQNLVRLAQYVSMITLEATEGTIEPRKLISLSRINVNIAEGLLRGQQSQLIQQRAYEIWEQEGRPEGRQNEHWLRAEAEFSGFMHVV